MGRRRSLQGDSRLVRAPLLFRTRLPQPPSILQAEGSGPNSLLGPLALKPGEGDSGGGVVVLEGAGTEPRSLPSALASLPRLPLWATPRETKTWMRLGAVLSLPGARPSLVSRARSPQDLGNAVQPVGNQRWEEAPGGLSLPPSSLTPHILSSPPQGPTSLFTYLLS